ncbi:unnamed protein product [Cuscuta epithymum]|uniref:DUF4283 domain-containing protein n=1 Tax=Cuscuta epithymum TaxID=186058 RepID=A0AAV0C9M8_9ASTE|nr:unnamed protein product [Cuscuta epithymum]
MAIGEADDELDFDTEEVSEEEVNDEQIGFPVVGTVISDRRVNLQALQDAMTLAWRPGMGVSIKEIDVKRYLFTFNHVLDMNRALEDGPWVFERDLVLLKTVQPDDIPEKLILFEADFWVQVHNVPQKFRNLNSTKRIGNFFGSFIKFDERSYGDKTKSFLRIKIRMDVRKPLKRGTSLKKEGRGHWVDFKYDKLPNFCFICGVIGHSDKFCLLRYEEGIIIEKSFGVELRVGGGVKTTRTGANKWLIQDPVNFKEAGQQRKHELEETQSAGTGASASMQAAGDVEGEPGETKRRRLWEDKLEEDTDEEGMVLDGPKNGEVAGRIS